MATSANCVFVPRNDAVRALHAHPYSISDDEDEDVAPFSLKLAVNKSMQDWDQHYQDLFEIQNKDMQPQSSQRSVPDKRKSQKKSFGKEDSRADEKDVAKRADFQGKRKRSDGFR